MLGIWIREVDERSIWIRSYLESRIEWFGNRLYKRGEESVKDDFGGLGLLNSCIGVIFIEKGSKGRELGLV